MLNLPAREPRGRYFANKRGSLWAEGARGELDRGVRSCYNFYMFNAEYEEEVAVVARSLWQDGLRTLRWSSMPSSPTRPWVESWADVYIKEMCVPLEASWLATIVSHSDEEEEGYGYWKVAHDAILSIEFADDTVPTRRTLLRPGRPPLDIPIGEDEMEESDFYWNYYRQDRYLDSGAQTPTYLLPVWTTSKIAEVVEDWIERISGHRFRLEIDGDLRSPFEEQAIRAKEEIEARGVENFHDLGDGLLTTDEVMDSLLEDPHGAAEITAEIKKATRPN